MSNVINFPGKPTDDIDPNNVLEGAKDQCQKVLVLGFDEDDLLYVAASFANVGELLRIVEIFKMKLIRGDFEECE